MFYVKKINSMYIVIELELAVFWINKSFKDAIALYGNFFKITSTAQFVLFITSTI
jgi:hypothetical protein